MSASWQNPIARIERDGAVIGTGFLVDAGAQGTVLLTCAHVINQYLQRNEYSPDTPPADLEFTFSLPFAPGTELYSGSAIEWEPPRTEAERGQFEVCDVAVLKVNAMLPRSVRPFKTDFFLSIDPDSDHVRSFGFPEENGLPAKGTLESADAGGWWLFTASNEHAPFIEGGFSGAPLLSATDQTVLGMVVAVRQGQASERVAYAVPTKCLWKAAPFLARPYKGLSAFEEEDRDLFFGREALIQQLIDVAEEHPIVGLNAPSGSGKSSVIKAGLIPQLRSDGVTEVISMRPGTDAWRPLYEALVRLSDPEGKPASWKDRTDASLATIGTTDTEPDVAKAAKEARNLLTAITQVKPLMDRLLIYVDQFEELFLQSAANGTISIGGTDEVSDGSEPSGGEASNVVPLRQDPPSVRAFIALMIDLATGDGVTQVKWCYSIRSDYSGRINPYREFVDLLAGGEIKLAAMTSQELREAITSPAQAFGVSFEAHPETGELLSDRILTDAGHQDGTLPLLEHLLEQLWERMSDSELSHRAYDDLGGLGGALNKYADSVVSNPRRKLDPKSLKRLFFRLVDPQEDGQATRRLVRKSELIQEEDWETAQFLAAKRLVTLRGGNTDTDADTVADTESETAEVAHEALLSHWGMLRDWVDQNRDFLRWAKGFRMAVGRWEAKGKPVSSALTGDDLRDAENRLRNWRDYLNESEIELIETSLKIEKKQNKLRKIAVYSFLIFACSSLIIMIYLLIDAEKAKNRALLEAEAAETAQFIAEGARSDAEEARLDAETARSQAEITASVYATAVSDQLIRNDSAVEGRMLLLEHLPTDVEFETLRRERPVALAGLSRAIHAASSRPGVLASHTDYVEHAGFSPDGTRIVTASSDGTARLWDGATGIELAVLTGHADSVVHASFSRDGTRIVTASSDNTARLWDGVTGVELAVLTGHTRRVRHASFSPDGMRIITASSDGTARLWDGATGIELAVLTGHAGPVRHAGFSPDGTRIVTASSDETARLWDGATGIELAVLTGHSGSVVHASFSPDGTRIVTVSSDNTARLWDGETVVELAVLTGHRDWVRHASFSPDGTRIVTASDDRTARLWDGATGVEMAVLTGHRDWVRHASFSPDGTRIVTSSDDGTTRLWDNATGVELVVLTGHADYVGHASFSPDGARIVTASDDTTARLWDGRTGVELAVLTGHREGVRHAGFSPNGTRIVTASSDSTARLWDGATGAQLAVLLGHRSVVKYASFSPDGTRIVTASSDSTARLWDGATGAELAVLTGHADNVEHADFSPDSTRIVTASDDNTARLWDGRTGVELAVLTGHTSDVIHAVFSPDGARIITASYDGTARLWDGTTGIELAVLTGHAGGVFHASFSPDGTRIVTASDDRTARLWDGATGVEMAVLTGHTDWVGHASFSPDGARIVTASGDGTARLWDGATGIEMAILTGHTSWVRHAGFSPDGTRIITASSDDTARLWDGATGIELAVLTSHASTITHAGFSPDGTRIVTTSYDGTARFWNVLPVEIDWSSGSLEYRSQPPLSEALLDHASEFHPGALTCEERYSILRDKTC